MPSTAQTQSVETEAGLHRNGQAAVSEYLFTYVFCNSLCKYEYVLCLCVQCTSRGTCTSSQCSGVETGCGPGVSERFAYLKSISSTWLLRPTCTYAWIASTLNLAVFLSILKLVQVFCQFDALRLGTRYGRTQLRARAIDCESRDLHAQGQKILLYVGTLQR